MINNYGENYALWGKDSTVFQDFQAFYTEFYKERACLGRGTSLLMY